MTWRMPSLTQFALGGRGWQCHPNLLCGRSARELAKVTTWDFSPPWPAGSVALWGTVTPGWGGGGFPFVAIEADARLPGTVDYSDRAMVPPPGTRHSYRAGPSRLVPGRSAPGWWAGQAFRMHAEDGDTVLGIPSRRRFLTLLADFLRTLAGERGFLGLLVLRMGGALGGCTGPR